MNIQLPYITPTLISLVEELRSIQLKKAMSNFLTLDGKNSKVLVGGLVPTKINTKIPEIMLVGILGRLVSRMLILKTSPILINLIGNEWAIMAGARQMLHKMQT